MCAEVLGGAVAMLIIKPEVGMLDSRKFQSKEERA